MSSQRCSVRSILNDAFDASLLRKSQFSDAFRVDSSDDYLAITTFLRPSCMSSFTQEDYKDENQNIAVRRFRLKEGKELKQGLKFLFSTSISDFGNTRRQCTMFSDVYEYESPFGMKPQTCDISTIATTFYPSRMTIRLALDRNNKHPDISRQIFFIKDIKISILNDLLNEVFEIHMNDQVYHLSFFYCLVHRAMKFGAYTISSIILKSFLISHRKSKLAILWCMYIAKCVYCGLSGKVLIFHDERYSSTQYVLGSVLPNCRSSGLDNYFDFNSESIFANGVVWISSHLIALINETGYSSIPWNSSLGCISIVTLLMRLLKSNWGRRVTSNGIARAYIGMMKG